MSRDSETISWWMISVPTFAPKPRPPSPSLSSIPLPYVPVTLLLSPLIDCQNLKGYLTRDEMIRSVTEIYRERKNLARTIMDSSEYCCLLSPLRGRLTYTGSARSWGGFSMCLWCWYSASPPRGVSWPGVAPHVLVGVGSGLQHTPPALSHHHPLLRIRLRILVQSGV